MYPVNQLFIGNRGGTTDKDREFSFGQVLALSTWVPVIIEFAYIYLEGPKKALTGKIMEPLLVVSRKDMGDQGVEGDGSQAPNSAFGSE
jgi:hypothetical protein